MGGLADSHDSEEGWEYILDSFDNGDGTYDLKVVKVENGHPVTRLVTSYRPQDSDGTNKTAGRDYRDYVIGPMGGELDPSRDDLPEGANNLVSKLNEEWGYNGKGDVPVTKQEFDSYYSNPDNDFEDNNLLPGEYKKPAHIEAHKRLTESFQSAPNYGGLAGYGGIKNEWTMEGKKKVLRSSNIGR